MDTMPLLAAIGQKYSSLTREAMDIGKTAWQIIPIFEQTLTEGTRAASRTWSLANGASAVFLSRTFPTTTKRNLPIDWKKSSSKCKMSSTYLIPQVTPVESSSIRRITVQSCVHQSITTADDAIAAKPWSIHLWKVHIIPPQQVLKHRRDTWRMTGSAMENSGAMPGIIVVDFGASSVAGGYWRRGGNNPCFYGGRMGCGKEK